MPTLILRRLALTLILLVIIGLFTACHGQGALALPADTPSPAAVTRTPAAVLTATPPPAEPPATLTATAEPTVPDPPVWPTPQPLPSPFAVAPLSPAELETARLLAAASPPERDDVTLAMEFLGVTAAAEPPAPAALPVAGAVDSFTVLNTDDNTYSTVEAILLGSGERAHFWFDTADTVPNSADLAPLASAFDAIYEDVVAAFGPESNPGIDGDPRLHILHASPTALCASAVSCGLLGYFSSADSLPRAAVPHSNERDIFIMNTRTFGTGTYLHVLAHEFRHMIEDNYDRSDADWVVEGSAMLAEELAGFTENAHARANLFLARPDLQLNSWTESGTAPYYGMAYLMNRYLYDQLGPDLYRAFAAHPADGLNAVTEVAAANGLPLTGQTLWEAWQVALALHNHPQAPAEYRLGDGSLDTAAATSIATLPFELATTVNQYAGDYYTLEGDGSVQLTFTGAQRVPLLDVAAASGHAYWVAQRANFSQSSLLRRVDLRGASGATLTYDVYHDIEAGYDFGYVAVSTDGGRTWQGLAGEQMQGLEPQDDPSGKALAPRFYTGTSDGWLSERIDLSAYAGQEILLRFSYVTDPILTYGGLALDNISIPEIWLLRRCRRSCGGLAGGWL
jgi:immune inhibitor A